MTKKMWCVQVAGVAIAVLMATGDCQGQLQRRFVSAKSGNDSNDCSAGAPCRTFARAMDATLDGGEVVVVDSGGYGPFTITKSIHVTAAEGVYAGISVFNGNGVTINAPGTAKVTLSNLQIQGMAAGVNGIRATQFQYLRINNCVLRGLSDGIYASTTGDAIVYIYDTSVSHCTFRGIDFNNSNAILMRTHVENCRLNNCIHGIRLVGNSRNLIRNCTFHMNQQAAVLGDGIANVTELENCAFTLNSVALKPGGIDGDDTSYFRVSNCTILNNSMGLDSQAGNDLRSFGNNRVSGNTSSDAFTSTIGLQ